jgi:co-chaperonin GroES (HSP10)
MKHIEVVGSRVLVQPVSEQKDSPLIQLTTAERVVLGRVVAAGPKSQAKNGDHVRYRYAYFEHQLEMSGEKFVLLTEDQVLLIEKDHPTAGSLLGSFKSGEEPGS